MKQRRGIIYKDYIILNGVLDKGFYLIILDVNNGKELYRLKIKGPRDRKPTIDNGILYYGSNSNPLNMKNWGGLYAIALDEIIQKYIKEARQTDVKF